MNTTKTVFGKAISIKTIVKKAREKKGLQVHFTDPSSCWQSITGTGNGILKSTRAVTPAL